MPKELTKAELLERIGELRAQLCAPMETPESALISALSIVARSSAAPWIKHMFYSRTETVLQLSLDMHEPK